MKKGLLSTVVIMMFSFSLLLGCSSSNSGGSGEPASSDGNDTSAANNGEKKTLRVSPDAWMIEKLHIKDAEKYFEEQHPNVDVIVKPYPGKDALATLALQWAKGESDVDIVMTDGMQNAVQFLAQDLLVDYNKTDFFEGKTAKENFVGDTLDYGNVKGVQFAIPISLEAYAISINKKMFKNADLVDDQGNITPPKTWEEVYEYAKKLKHDGIEGISIQWGPNAGSMMLATEIAANGTYETDGVLSYDTPKMRKILKNWRKGVETGVYSIATFTNKNAGRNAYRAGQLAMVAESGAHAAEAAPILGKKVTGVVPIPGSKENGSYAFAAGILIPKASKKRDLALQFVKEALMNKDIQLAVAQEWGKLPVLKEPFQKIDAKWKDTLFSIIKESKTSPYYSEYPVIDKNMPIYLQSYLTGEYDLDTFIEKVETMIDDIDKKVFK